MRLLHLSDLHLGFRALPGRERGWNLRERDLARAFQWMVQEAVRLRPDLLLLSGDVFDRPDPPSRAFLTLTRGVTRLRSQLPRTPLLVVAGERDTPRNPADPGPVAVLDALPGVEAAAGTSRAVRFRESGVHALLVPARASHGPSRPRLRPDPEARWNLLVLRGDPTRGGASGLPVDPSEWSYVAVGGSHRFRRHGPTMWTAGSLGRPGWNPWNEAMEERGFVTFDLGLGEGEFHPIPGRPVVDLAPVKVSREDRDAGSRRLRELLDGVPGGIDGKILRVRLRGDVLSPHEGVALGLLSAIHDRTAHVEFSVAEGGGAVPGVPSSGWRPRVLEVAPAGGGEPRRVPLEGGRVVLTSGSTAIRARLDRGLYQADASPTAGEEVLRLSPEPPRAAVASAVWAGDGDPVRLLARALANGDGTASGPEEGASGGGSSSPAGLDEGNAGGPGPPREVRERGLSELRADAVEASGDLEVRRMQWARERQDAESHLQACRDRARELRVRIRELEREGESAPCPTCGRPIGRNRSGLLETLREEWERVVQDGRWWKRRREQLENKPPELRGMEEGALRLQAWVEEAAEGLERARGGGGAGSPRAPEEGPPRATGEGPGLDRVAPRALREVLQRAGALLGRLTEGELWGVRAEGRELVATDRRGSDRVPGDDERRALLVSLRLALWERARDRGEGPGAVLIRELREAVDPTLVLRALDLVASTVPPEGAVLFLAPPEAAEREPDSVDQVLEFRADSRNRLEVRSRKARRPPLLLRDPNA